MTEQEVNELYLEIVEFMESLDYEVDEDVQKNIILALASGQYSIGRSRRKNIKWFTCWWKLDEHGLDCVLHRLRPPYIVGGNNLYGVEFAVKPGFIKDACKDFRKKGAPYTGIYWHRYKNNRLKAYPCHTKEVTQ